MYRVNLTIKQLNCHIIPMYVHIIAVVWSNFALSHSIMYVQNETIAFYNILISNLRTSLNHDKSIVIFYNLLTYWNL